MYKIGIDIGGTNIAAGIVDEYGQLLTKKTIPTRVRNAADMLGDMAGLVDDILIEQGIEGANVRHIGIGSPGTCDPSKGRVLYAANLNFENVDVCDWLGSRLNLPIYLQNDANCAALGEAKMGAGVEYTHSITVTFGTGIGGGIIIDGDIYSGPFFGAGEVGHHIIEMNGKLCTCGKRGCWEAYASATALIRDSGYDNAKAVFDASDAGVIEAVKAIDNYYQYIATGLANLIDILQPQIIILGGGIAERGESFLREAERRTRSIVFAGDLHTKLALAKLGNDAGIIGAAFLGD